VVAEKPSVARDIARVLGVRRKGNGCLEGDGYVVTWALGHLVHFSEPDDYGPPWNERWSMAQLPIVPQQWKLKTDKRTASQFQIVKKLINDSATQELIVATDAGREGENIFRLIYEHARCKKPCRRLWVSSLTDSAIRQGLERLQPGSVFDDLAAAARTRAQADWLIGMNLTRAYTVHNKGLCTIGRVQTPTLAMLVERERQIADFKKAFFYELVARLQEGFSAKYSKDGQTRIDKKEEAEKLHQQLSPHKVGTVADIQVNVRRHRPPPLYNLVELQRDANRRFGFTAAKVLEHAQALYETHKLITYPRTESRHISEDMVPQLPQILENMDHPQAGAALERLRSGLRLSKAYVDKNKLTDHHAIIPTGQKPSPTLPPPLRKVYNLVAARFVAIFLPDHVVEETTVTLDIGGACFVAKGSKVLEEGWKVVEPRRENRRQDDNKKKGDDAAGNDAEEEDRSPLPPLTKGQQVHVEGMEVVEKETKPPRRYSDATLLTAMKNAGRQIEDEALAEAMKESGLGTPATRAETIERLIRSGYAERQKKNLAPTEKGKGLIGAVAEPLRSPQLTAEWERKLKEVEEGRLSAAQFYSTIVNFVEGLIPRVGDSPMLPAEAFADRRGGKGRGKGARNGGGEVSVLGSCPKCKKGSVRENTKAYGCSRFREGCDFTIWKTVARKKLTEKQAKELLAEGKTTRIKGFTAKSGKKFDAVLKFDADFKVVFDFGSEDGGKRPPSFPSQRRPATENRSAALKGSDEEHLPPLSAYEDSPSAYDSPPSNYEELPSAYGPTLSANPPPAAAEEPAIPPRKPAPSAERQAPNCPKCGQGQIIEGKRGYGCNRFREGCNFVVWKEIAGKKLTENQIYQLIDKGKTRLLKGFKGKSGRPFQARLVLSSEWKTEFEFE
jgi:DNA topoisomerase III